MSYSLDEAIGFVAERTVRALRRALKNAFRAHGLDITPYQFIVLYRLWEEEGISQVDLARRTRPGENGAPEYVRELVSWGAGVRASQYLILTAKARSVLHGRYSPSVEDVRAVARPVLRHRIVTNFNAEAEGVDTVQIVDRLMDA